MTPLQRVLLYGCFLPVVRFRGATGQIRASDAIPEAHPDLQTLNTVQDRSVCHQLLSRYNENSTTMSFR